MSIKIIYPSADALPGPLEDKGALNDQVSVPTGLEKDDDGAASSGSLAEISTAASSKEVALGITSDGDFIGMSGQHAGTNGHPQAGKDHDKSTATADPGSSTPAVPGGAPGAANAPTYLGFPWTTIYYPYPVYYLYPVYYSYPVYCTYSYAVPGTYYYLDEDMGNEIWFDYCRQASELAATSCPTQDEMANRIERARADESLRLIKLDHQQHFKY